MKGETIERRYKQAMKKAMNSSRAELLRLVLEELTKQRDEALWRAGAG